MDWEKTSLSHQFGKGPQLGAPCIILVLYHHDVTLTLEESSVPMMLNRMNSFFLLLFCLHAASEDHPELGTNFFLTFNEFATPPNLTPYSRDVIASLCVLISCYQTL
jgi:hypothetical protein